jgi:hypothetical protein
VPALLEGRDRKRRQGEEDEEEYDRMQQQQHQSRTQRADNGVDGRDDVVQRLTEQTLVLPQQLQAIQVVAAFVVLDSGQVAREPGNLPVEREPDPLRESDPDGSADIVREIAQRDRQENTSRAEDERGRVTGEDAVGENAEEPPEQRIHQPSERSQQRPE